MEAQRKGKALGVWEGRGGKGDFILRGLRWLWVVHARGNVEETNSYLVLQVRRVIRARYKDLEVKSI